MATMDAYEAISYRPESDTFDVRGALRRVLNAVFGHKLLIVACCILSVGAAVTYIKTFPPVFVASVLLSIEGDRPSRDLFYYDWNLYRKGDVASEGELMTGSGPIGVVADELGLSYDDVYHTALSHLRYLWQTSALGIRYKSLKDRIFLRSERPESRLVPPPEVIERARVVSGFKDGTTMKWVAGTDAAYLIVRGPTPRVADYANKLIDAYLVLRRQKLIDEAEASYEMLAREVERVRAERDRLINEKRKFEEKNKLVLGFEKDRVGLRMWGDLRSQINDLEILEKSYAAKVDVLEKLLRNQERIVTKSRSLGRNSVREDMRRSMVELRTDLVKARQKFRPDSPEIKELEDLVSNLERLIPEEPEMVESASTREINSTYIALQDQLHRAVVSLAATRAELETQRKIVKPLGERLEAIPALEMKAAKMKQEMELLESRYGMLVKKFTTADISRFAAASLPSTIEVIERATPPFLPAWPKTKLLVGIALMVGLLGGAALALFVDILGNRVTLDRLSLRSDLPVYATIDVQGPGGSGGLRRLAGPIARGSGTRLLSDERRMHRRFGVPSTRKILVYLEDPDGRVIDGELCELSLGGAVVKLPQLPLLEDRGQPVNCSIRLSSERVVQSRVGVRRVFDEEGSSIAMVGLSFVGLSRQAHVDVRRLIAELERESRRPPSDA